MSKMFDLLKEGLEEAIEYHRGNIKLRTKDMYSTASPYTYNQIQITVFSCLLCENERTEDWSKKEYPFKICNECKADLHKN